MSLVITILIFVAALVLGLALAYVPMRLLLGQMARGVRAFIQRQRDRRQAQRATPDRRKAQMP